MNEQLLFAVCIFGLVVAGGWMAAAWLFSGKSARLRQRLVGAEPKRTSANQQDGAIKSVFAKLGEAAAKPFMPNTREKQSSLRRKLGQAGIYSSSALRVMTGCKVIFLGVGLLGGYFIGTAWGNLLLGLSVGGLVGYLLPVFWLKLQIGKNGQALARALPDALDLMVVCVEAGLTIDAAVQRVGQELALAHPALARELGIAHMETRIGLSRSESLRNLGQRTNSAPLQSLASVLIQAERFGTSVATALRTHAESLRTTRQYAAEEMAAKAAVKISFPVVLFIFPAVLIIIAGPACIGLFKSGLMN